MRSRHLFVVTLLLCSTVFPVATAQFSDTSETSLSFLYRRGLVDGYSDGTFRPDAGINRAELVKMIMHVGGLEATAPNAPCFTDFPTESWYNSFVCTAKNKGWVEGYADGTFRPEALVNRAEASKIIVRTLGILPRTGFDLDEYIPHNFKDVQPEDWFSHTVDLLKMDHLIDFDSTFDPGGNMTRGAVADILYRKFVTEHLYTAIDIAVNEIINERDMTLTQAQAILDGDFLRITRAAESLTVQDLLDQQAAIDEYDQYDHVMVREQEGVYYAAYQLSTELIQKPRTTTRGHVTAWTVVAIEAETNKVIGYDIFQYFVDRPSLMVQVDVLAPMQVQVRFDGVGPAPGYIQQDMYPPRTFTLSRLR